MVCKNCQKELDEGSKVCPYCGEPVEEDVTEAALEVQEAAEETSAAEETACETEAVQEPVLEDAQEASDEEVQEEAPVKKRKLKTWQLVLAIVGGVVLLGVLVCAVLYGLGVDLKPRENNVLYKDSYTVTDEKAQSSADKVVATIGNKALTNGELQLHYWSGIYDFINQYYYYMSMFGLDYTQPLDEQICMGDETMTWQQYFVDYALDSWQYYSTLALLAEDAGFTMSEDAQQYIDELPANAQQIADAYGYDSILAWLQEDAGPGVTMEGYTEYVSTYYLGAEYLASCYEAMVPTQEEVEAYYAENEETLTESGITKDTGLISSVRHILVAPDATGTDEEGNAISTEEDWAAAYAEAEQILDEWKSGEATEESFATLVSTYTDDTASAATGGLYEDVYVDGGYVEEFTAWAIDTNRVSGDTGIVETQFGYHIMYFVDGEDYWRSVASEKLLTQRIQDMITAGMEKYPMEVDYKKIVLGEMTFE